MLWKRNFRAACTSAKVAFEAPFSFIEARNATTSSRPAVSGFLPECFRKAFTYIEYILMVRGL